MSNKKRVLLKALRLLDTVLDGTPFDIRDIAAPHMQDGMHVIDITLVVTDEDMQQTQQQTDSILEEIALLKKQAQADIGMVAAPRTNGVENHEPIVEELVAKAVLEVAGVTDEEVQHHQEMADIGELPEQEGLPDVVKPVRKRKRRTKAEIAAGVPPAKRAPRAVTAHSNVPGDGVRIMSLEEFEKAGALDDEWVEDGVEE